MVLTPWVILLLPPNPAAVYDTFLWFGGTWHALGAIYTILLMIKFQERQVKFLPKLLIVIALSAWSEISAITILIMIIYSILRSSEKGKYLLVYLFFPTASILSHFFKSQTSGRLDAIHSGNLVLDLMKMFFITMKFSTQWAFCGLLLGIIFARVNLRFQEYPMEVKTEKNASINPILLFVCLGTIGISTIGYPSWRSTFIIGLAVTIYSAQYFSGYFSRRNRSYQLLKVISILLLFGTGFNSSQTVQQAVTPRAIWWETSQTLSKESIKILKLPKEQRNALPGDYGYGDWINICFIDFWDRNKI
jgi:hypothetical protein